MEGASLIPQPARSRRRASDVGGTWSRAGGMRRPCDQSAPSTTGPGPCSWPCGRASLICGDHTPRHAIPAWAGRSDPARIPHDRAGAARAGDRQP